MNHSEPGEAIATLAGCLSAVIWWACHRPNRVWWRYTAWSLMAMAMSWWLVALILLFRISSSGAAALAPPWVWKIDRLG
ncbi:MAG: DUF3367 domain-containing protein [Mycobacterium sp.]|nr:DUF3367 domain-containing protein [Mycobacterium sp.]